jgi:hypothetical protein
VPDPGHGYVQLGFSRKTASSSWDGQGNAFVNLTRQGVISYHDFRYTYLSGEVGIVRNLSAQFLFTYLYGLEGPHSDPEKNVGFSDSWLSLKYQVHHGELPMAVQLVYRTPFLYDLPGAYSRYIYNSDGSIRSPSPEWRGLLKHDYTLLYLVSRSFEGGKGWWDVEFGYTWRDGSPADQFPFYAEVGHRIPRTRLQAKLWSQWVRSRANNSTPQPDDRFGMTGDHYNFNRASLGRVGLSILAPLNRRETWVVEIGYDQWIWGRSARRYREPYISLSRLF